MAGNQPSNSRNNKEHRAQSDSLPSGQDALCSGGQLSYNQTDLSQESLRTPDHARVNAQTKQTIESPFQILGSVEIPMDYRVARSDELLEIFAPKRGGGEFLFMRDSAWNGRHIRKFFDSKGQVHRPEQDGPAIIDPHFGRQEYRKHGKLHRTHGPAYERTVDLSIEGRGLPKELWEKLKNQIKSSRLVLYYLEGRELPKEVWEQCKETGRPPKMAKFDIAILRSKAAELGQLAFEQKKIGQVSIPPNEHDLLKRTTRTSNWAKGDQEMLPDGSWDVTMNCTPLNELDCVIRVDPEGKIINARLVLRQ